MSETVVRYEVQKYTAGNYRADGTPCGPGAGSLDVCETYKTLEEAMARYESFDLKSEWLVRYNASNGRDINTEVVAVEQCEYRRDDEGGEYEFVGEIDTVAERWYGIEEHRADNEQE